MNVLIIGSGGREHALAWKIQQSPNAKTVIVAPGNGSSGKIDLNPNKPSDVIAFCKEKTIDCVVIGPEEPLANGLADHLISALPHVLVFGPIRNGAQMETSKFFSKQFMKEYDLPTADFVTIDNVKDLDGVLERVSWKNMVVKADGLAAGKGVIIPKDKTEAKEAAKAMLQGEFGTAGRQVIIEERLEGYEVSALAFVDGINFRRMPLGKDHKRLFESDVGPNTGGMGVVAPVHVPESVDKKIDEIFEKTLKGLADRNIPYCGVLYAGFMIVKDEPYLLEFNCRFGDPETQVLMRLLESDLLAIICACVRQRLSTCDIKWSSKSACGVVLASANYPKSGDKGTPITEIPSPDLTNVVFHAGTSLINNTLVTNGGRILCVTSVADTLRDARDHANKIAGIIQFEGKQYRKDIGMTSEQEATSTSLSYGASGVNIDEGNQFVEDIKSLVKKTLLPGATQIGGFGAVLDLKKAGFPSDSQLVVGIDGVGTKIEVATACNNFSGIGFDVVAMCVNDVLCHCAKPVAFLDYYVCGRLNRTMATQVLASISEACIEAGCSLIGGETAEMPGVYNPHQWDLAGCAIAARDSSWPMLPLSSEIKEGDVIIGLASSGLHSNGFSLARKVLSVNGIKYQDTVPWDPSTTFGTELLRGTKLYVKSVLPLLTSGLVKGCAHITGGGLTENAIRVLDKTSDVTLVIDCKTWKPKELFNWIAAAGPVETKEMIRTFNCGIGMILVVEKSHVKPVMEALTESKEEFCRIGHIAKSQNGELIKFLNEETLFNRTQYTYKRKRVKVAILISGTGTNMKKLIERSKTPDSNCEVVVVVSNKANAGGLNIAVTFGIPTRVVPHTADRITGDQALVEVLKEFGTELVCLGGYMRILSPLFVGHFPSRIINIHPSLLPSFIGAHALQDALDFGAKVVGCTAHFVDELVDHGAIIAQRPVMVEEGDTIEILRQKIQVQEHEMFPEAMIEVAAKILQSEQ